MDHPTDQRRSERKTRSIAVHLSAALADGTTAEVQAETLVVNKHGAKIQADLNLLLGCPVKIAVEGVEEPVEAVVAWVSKDSPGVFGVELLSSDPPWDEEV